MTVIPQSVIDHCARHPMCRGCPLGTCVAPVTQYPSPCWDEWLAERIATVRALQDGSAA